MVASLPPAFLFNYNKWAYTPGMWPLLVFKLRGFAYAEGALFLTSAMWQVFTAFLTHSQT